MRDRKRVSLGDHCTRGGLERYIILKLVRVADIANWSGVEIAFFLRYQELRLSYPTRACVRLVTPQASMYVPHGLSVAKGGSSSRAGQNLIRGLTSEPQLSFLQSPLRQSLSEHPGVPGPTSEVNLLTPFLQKEC